MVDAHRLGKTSREISIAILISQLSKSYLYQCQKKAKCTEGTTEIVA